MILLVASTGSPAHAGMDPSPSRRCVANMRLPRSRGDGPARDFPRCVSSVAPPLTRGWTRICIRIRCGRFGSPAHAGMDPAHLASLTPAGWLPRSRGDGPAGGIAITGNVTAPPLTRGWTLQPTIWRTEGAGSPAHAGMDPRRPCRCARRTWLPRSRGDGPEGVQLTRKAAVAPPLTRGWTRAPGVAGRRGRGSPAHAGMDPRTARRSSSCARLPRSRGDGPYSPPRASLTSRAPPLTRGWTPRDLITRILERGSPAHAGMDPSPLSHRDLRTRLPRSRGDGPRSRCR